MCIARDGEEAGARDVVVGIRDDNPGHDRLEINASGNIESVKPNIL